MIATAKYSDTQVARHRILPLDLLDSDEIEVQIKTMGISQLADAYCVSRKTFVKWIQPWIIDLIEHGYTVGDRKINPACVRLIFERLGQP